MKLLERKIKSISFFESLSRKKWGYKRKKIFYDWLENKRPLPMPHYGKQKTLLEYAKNYELKTMIETGTYKGDMAYSMQPYFEKIYSIELGWDLYNKARERLSKYKNVQLIQGNSGELLPEIIKNINQPCLFWLDAHYSGGKTVKHDLETPIMQELTSIFEHPCINKHVILIDDARCFTGTNDYPTTDFLKKYILSKCPNWIVEVKDDIIRSHLKGKIDH
jgi:hypothetical protein